MLNERGVPSPGSSWKRTTRRTAGWMHSAVVGMAERSTGLLRNELFVGRQIWNKRRSKKVPGTSRRRFELRPKSEWIVVDAPELRIVPQDLWDRVQGRLAGTRARATEGQTARRGYHVSRYVLSGLIQCGVCGS